MKKYWKLLLGHLYDNDSFELTSIDYFVYENEWSNVEIVYTLDILVSHGFCETNKVYYNTLIESINTPVKTFESIVFRMKVTEKGFEFYEKIRDKKIKRRNLRYAVVFSVFALLFSISSATLGWLQFESAKGKNQELLETSIRINKIEKQLNSRILYQDSINKHQSTPIVGKDYVQ
ncbi:MAG TPA: hypothetical protein VNX01_15660 [Bacteroidia bacterium]|jgi:hypothetical protein|nr:hypothetical protein [Bacteroidia bacterium]